MIRTRTRTRTGTGTGAGAGTRIGARARALRVTVALGAFGALTAGLVAMTPGIASADSMDSLSNLNSGLILDVRGGSDLAGVPVDQWQDNQWWGPRTPIGMCGDLLWC
jgi:hypothetical protein